MNNLDEKREEILKKINQYNAGLLITNFGEDLATMSFLQADCLADDLLSILKDYGAIVEQQTRDKVIEEFFNRSKTDGLYYTYHRLKSKPTTDDKCFACGKTYEQHEILRNPNEPIPRMPCLGLKSGFYSKKQTKENEQ